MSDLPVKVYAGADALSQIVESQPIGSAEWTDVDTITVKATTLQLRSRLHHRE